MCIKCNIRERGGLELEGTFNLPGLMIILRKDEQKGFILRKDKRTFSVLGHRNRLSSIESCEAFSSLGRGCPLGEVHWTFSSFSWTRQMPSSGNLPLHFVSSSCNCVFSLPPIPTCRLSQINRVDLVNLFNPPDSAIILPFRFDPIQRAVPWDPQMQRRRLVTE